VEVIELELATLSKYTNSYLKSEHIGSYLDHAFDQQVLMRAPTASVGGDHLFKQLSIAIHHTM